jgi:CRISPR/Cas system-associated exonuclease Cas4 (RecB family)
VIYAGEQVRRVKYNEVNRLWLNKVIAEVRMACTLPRVTRNHQMPGRCSGCGLRQSEAGQFD